MHQTTMFLNRASSIRLPINGRNLITNLLNLQLSSLDSIPLLFNKSHSRGLDLLTNLEHWIAHNIQVSSLMHNILTLLMMHPHVLEPKQTMGSLGVALCCAIRKWKRSDFSNFR
ncbi:hypothetical protein EV2_009334 [Malus domestica]